MAALNQVNEDSDAQKSSKEFRPFNNAPDAVMEVPEGMQYEGTSSPARSVASSSNSASESKSKGVSLEGSKKRKRDEYELPSAAPLGLAFDPRMVTEAELRDFIDEHKHDLDLSEIDVDSEVFHHLPVELQHEVILDAKLKSRQHSWERLDEMVRSAPTALDFSRLQIQNLVHRNTMTERYSEFTKNANVVVNPAAKGKKNKPSGRVETHRIAAERNRSYILVKNDENAGGGWVMKSVHSGVVDLTADEQQDTTKEMNESPGVATAGVASDDSDEDEDFVEVGNADSPAPLAVLGTVKPDTGKSAGLLFALDESEDEDAVQVLPNASVEGNTENKKSAGLVVDHSAYVDDDESVEAVMARFEELEDSMRTSSSSSGPRRVTSQKNTTTASLKVASSMDVLEVDTNEEPSVSDSQLLDALSPDDFLYNWVSLAPASLSLDLGNHEKVMKEAVKEWSSERIEEERFMATRRRDKLPLSQKGTDKEFSMKFWFNFLEALQLWRACQDDAAHNENVAMSGSPAQVRKVDNAHSGSDLLRTSILSPAKKPIGSPRSLSIAAGGASKQNPGSPSERIERERPDLKSPMKATPPKKVTSVLMFDSSDDEDDSTESKGQMQPLPMDEDTRASPREHEAPRNVRSVLIFDSSDEEDQKIEESKPVLQTRAIPTGKQHVESVLAFGSEDEDEGHTDSLTPTLHTRDIRDGKQRVESVLAFDSDDEDVEPTDSSTSALQTRDIRIGKQQVESVLAFGSEDEDDEPTENVSGRADLMEEVRKEEESMRDDLVVDQIFDGKSALAPGPELRTVEEVLDQESFSTPSSPIAVIEVKPTSLAITTEEKRPERSKDSTPPSNHDDSTERFDSSPLFPPKQSQAVSLDDDVQIDRAGSVSPTRWMEVDQDKEDIIVLEEGSDNDVAFPEPVDEVFQRVAEQRKLERVAVQAEPQVAASPNNDVSPPPSKRVRFEEPVQPTTPEELEREDTIVIPDFSPLKRNDNSQYLTADADADADVEEIEGEDLTAPIDVGDDIEVSESLSSATFQDDKRGDITVEGDEEPQLQVEDHEIDGAVDVPVVLNEEHDEFARFLSEISNKDVASVQQELEQEMVYLKGQKRREQRDAENISSEMVRETQELLRYFGLPYIVAPMEAESQCAFLLRSELVDGIVTDDSDVFLFGGTRVYKNMFNQSKYVESYLLDELQRDMRLSRDKLIDLAYLLGSDYTEGIPGIGVVTAVEILNEFGSGIEGLTKFKSFWEAAHRGQADVSGNKLRKKLLRVCQKVTIPDHFPDERVAQAYLQPMVDESEVTFQWGMPDLDAIRDYLDEKLAWEQKKVDDVLLPVLKEMNRRAQEGAQSTLEMFFAKVPGRGMKHKSARVTRVLASWAGDQEVAEEQGKAASKGGKGTKSTRGGIGSKKRGSGSQKGKSAKSTSSKSSTGSSGRGRGRGRGRGAKRQAGGRGSSSKSSEKEASSPVNIDVSDDDV
ncbi:DNA repair protein rad2 [Quaeritorhiza haematococci]|nr:DNA repair protein rad2 [Quaeritorhiza haematococci]